MSEEEKSGAAPEADGTHDASPGENSIRLGQLLSQKDPSDLIIYASNYQNDDPSFPEKLLWAAVAELAIQDAVKPPGIFAETAKARVKKEAQRWFKEIGEIESQEVGGLRWVCEALGTEPTRMIRRLGEVASEDRRRMTWRRGNGRRGAKIEGERRRA